MTWDPPIDIAGNRAILRISASDVSSDGTCGRALAFKIRPQVSLRTWQPSRAPWGTVPFVLGDVLDIATAAHKQVFVDYQAQRAWVEQRMDQGAVHRLLRSYVAHSIENYLDAHEASEAEIGEPLAVAERNPSIDGQGRSLNVWGPLYTSSSGVREIRRVRIGAARVEPEPGDMRWAATAAEVARRVNAGTIASRIRVVEVGLADGSRAVLLDCDPQQVVTTFAAQVRPHIESMTTQDHVVTGWDCNGCKAAGGCEALIPMDGLFDLTRSRLGTRSVSASALKTYSECPARWLMTKEIHLPQNRDESHSQVRGNAVHRWLALAHSRGTACAFSDLPTPGEESGIADGVLDALEYELAFPYLLNHVNDCPLAQAGAVVVGVEKDVRGFDHHADLLAVARPDLLYMDDDVLVVREVKSSEREYAGGRDEAYDRNRQVPFMLRMFASGLASKYGVASGRVEIELLTPQSQSVFTWSTDDAALSLIAADDLTRSVEEWHEDGEWRTKPGPQCTRCPVARWCPDADAGRLTPDDGGMANAADAEEEDDDDVPPF